MTRDEAIALMQRYESAGERARNAYKFLAIEPHSELAHTRYLNLYNGILREQEAAFEQIIAAVCQGERIDE